MVVVSLVTTVGPGVRDKPVSTPTLWELVQCLTGRMPDGPGANRAT